MLNIWIINHYAAPPEYEVRVRNNAMAKYLQQLGYNVKIFASSTIHNTNINLIEDKNKLFIEKKYDGLEFIHLRTSNYSGNGISRVINMLQFPVRFYKVAKKAITPPDIIICDLEAIFAASPYFISKKFKAKFILEVRDLWPESIVEYMGISRKNLIIKILYKLEKWIYKKADALIFCMEGGKDYIKDKGWEDEIDSSKIHYINNGVDLEVFNKNLENYKIHDADLENTNIFKVVYTGSIRLANNVKKIVESAQKVQTLGYNSIKFLIYGDGPDKLYLEQYCIENRIENVVFKGYLNKKYIPYVLSKCDLNILHFEQNSLKKYGASLNKLFEYFASGKPTVSDCEFGYDLIKKYNCGVVYDNADSQQIADVVILFSNLSPQEYEKYCNNALKAAKDFDYKELTSKIDWVIKNIGNR